MGQRYQCAWLVAAVHLIALSVSTSVYNVADYGAYPNDGADDTEEIQAAVNAAIAAASLSVGNQHLIYLSTGTYDMSAAVVISGAYNLTFSGSGMNIGDDGLSGGTLLLGHSVAGMISVYNSANIHLTQFAIDFEPLAFTAGYITAIDERTADLFSVDVKVVPPHTADDGRLTDLILKYDPRMMRPARGNYNFNAQPPSNRSVVIAPGLVRFFVVSRPALSVNDPVIVHYLGGPSTITPEDVTDFRLSSVTEYTGWGMGLVSLRARRVSVHDFHVRARFGRWASQPSDCMHLMDNRESITITDSSCQSQMDDGLNVMCFYYYVIARTDDRTLVLSTRHGADSFQLGVGEVLTFSRAATPYTDYMTAVIDSYTIYNDTAAQFTFTSSVVAVAVGDSVTVANPPALTIRNLTVGHNRARGVLLETHNVHVSQCFFNATSGPAILFEQSTYWREATHARNVTVTENVFLDCNEGIGQEEGLVSFSPTPIQVNVSVFQGISITRSSFFMSSAGRGLIQGWNGGNVSLSDNYIRTANVSFPLISVCNSINMSAANNAVDNQFGPPRYYVYDTQAGCAPEFSRNIDFPPSAFQARFGPPVLPAPSGFGVIFTRDTEHTSKHSPATD